MFGENENLANVKLRPRLYELISYREFNWNNSAPSAIKEIIIGPAADQNKAIHFANECLKVFHRENVDVRNSNVPYRAL